MKKTKCSVCSSDTFKIFSYGKIPLCDAYCKTYDEAKKVNRYSLDFYKCKLCTHIELGYKVPAKKMYSRYLYRSSHSSDLDKHFQEYAQSALKFNLKKKNILDVGCNDGLLLDKFKSLGISTYGVEPSAAAKEASKKKHKIYRDFFTHKISRSFGMRFEIVTVNNVLANVLNLKSFTELLSNTVSNTGIVIIETLSSNVLLKNRVFEMFNHEHYHYFSPKSLIKLFSYYKLWPIDISLFEAKGGNMRVIFSKNRTLKKNYKFFTHQLTKNHISNFIKSINFEKNRLKNFIKNFKNTPIIFGSYAGTTILRKILFPNLKFKFIIDDNKSRWGYFSPGIGAKCLPPMKIIKKKSPIIIASWRFAEEILKRHIKTFKNKNIYVINQKKLTLSQYN